MRFADRRDGFEISTDPGRLDVGAVHAFLAQMPWSPGVARDVVERALRHSLCFGVYRAEAQIGLARVITDFATFGYVADVYLLPEFRGRGLARWLMRCIMAHPDLRTVRRLLLTTSTAPGLYLKLGFQPVRNPGGHLEWRPQAPAS